jgi:hypothetical protein
MSILRVSQIKNTTSNPLLVGNDLTVSGTLRATNLILVSGATNTPIDITYSSLYNKIINSNLLVGATYRLTDYRSVNFLNGYLTALYSDSITPINPNFKPKEVYTSTTETLLLKSISTSELEPIVYSENYSEDIIEYIPHANTINLPLSIYSGSHLPNSSIVPFFNFAWDGTNVCLLMPANYPVLFGASLGLYAEFSGISNYIVSGYINFLSPSNNYLVRNTNTPNAINLGRVSVLNNGLKIVFLDLTYQNYLDYVSNTLFVNSNYSIGKAYGKIIRREDTKNNIDVPFDFRNQKYRRFEIDLSPINISLGLGYYSIGDTLSFKNVNYTTTGNYKDFFVFNGGANNISWKSDFYNLIMGNDLNNVFFGSVHNSNINYGMYDNTFGNNFRYNSIDYSTYNIIGSHFEYNNSTSSNLSSPEYGFTKNLIGDFFINNTISGRFYQNTIESGFGSGGGSNKISNNFIDNIIGNNFGSQGAINVILSEFINNIIGDNFGSYNTNNYIASFFQNNIIGDNFGGGLVSDTGCGVRVDATSVIGLDFTSATHVYQPYNSRIFRASNGNLYLEYFNGTSMQYVSPTS